MALLSTSPRRRASGNRSYVAFSLFIAIGLLGAVVLSTGLTPSDLWAAIGRVPTWFFLPLALVQGLIVVLAARKWCLILSAHNGQSLPLGEGVAATAIGTLAGQALPIQLVTPVIRAWIARAHGISASRAIGTSILEQVFEIIVLGAMALAGVIAHFAGLSLILSVAFALAIAVIMTVFVAPGLRLAHSVAHAFALRFGGPFSTLADGFERAGRLPHRLLFQLTGLSILRYVLLAGLNVMILTQLAPQADPLVLLAAFPLVQLLTALPIVPAGLGIVEMTWSALLLTQGLSPTEVAGAALALRLISTFGFLLIAPFLIAPMLMVIRGISRGVQ